MSTESIEPLRLAFEVDCAPDHAFMTWTERIGTWWPADHTASGEDDSWHLRRDRADATEVEIRFQPSGTATRVEIEHRGWDRLGAAGRAWRDRNLGGWSTLLPHFIGAAGGGTPPQGGMQA